MDVRSTHYNGERGFNLFRFDEMGPATLYESSMDSVSLRSKLG